MHRFGIALATYNPDMGFFHEQLNSIQEQTFDGWCCVIGDDSTDIRLADLIREASLCDPRFYYFRNTAPAGIIGNFETILARLVSVSEYIVLCDQDDRWLPARLACIDAYLEAHQRSGSMPIRFINSNMSLIDANGRITCASAWMIERRLVELAHPIAYLFSNTATGCGAVVASELVRSVGLPFPKPQPGHSPFIFHDGWLAMCAAALGPVHLMWEPLVAYRQHGGNTVGVRKSFQVSLQDLLHQVLRPDLCLGAAKMLLPILQELASRLPDHVENHYSWSMQKVVCRGAWLALVRRSWSLPEWITALIGVTLHRWLYPNSIPK